MVNCDTTSQIWTTLQVYFASQIRAKKDQFKTHLQNTKKGSLSMNDFLLKIRNLVDLLALVGHKLSVKDHVDAIFDGLSSEYDTFVLTTNAHSDDYSVEDIESLLLAQEARIEKNLKNLDSAGSSSVNLAAINVSNNPANKRRPGGFNGHPSSGGYHTQNYRPNFSGRGVGRAFNPQFSLNSGRGRSGGRGQNKNQCQLSGRFGHVVVQCYYIIDSSFTGPSHFQQQHQNLGRFPQTSQAYVAQMGAMQATPEIVYDSNWYPDSGATNHVTADVANLMSKADFFDPDKVHMDNGINFPRHSCWKENLKMDFMCLTLHKFHSINNGSLSPPRLAQACLIFLLQD